MAVLIYQSAARASGRGGVSDHKGEWKGARKGEGREARAWWFGISVRGIYTEQTSHQERVG